MRQLEQLINETNRKISQDETMNRQDLVFACNLPTNRGVEKFLGKFRVLAEIYCKRVVIFPGDLLRKLGATSSALDIYIKLELWDEAVDCYRGLRVFQPKNR